MAHHHKQSDIDRKGNYEIQLTALPNTDGDHDIRTYFTVAATSKYKSSESPIATLPAQVVPALL